MQRAYVSIRSPRGHGLPEVRGKPKAVLAGDDIEGLAKEKVVDDTGNGNVVSLMVKMVNVRVSAWTEDAWPPPWTVSPATYVLDSDGPFAGRKERARRPQAGGVLKVDSLCPVCNGNAAVVPALTARRVPLAPPFIVLRRVVPEQHRRGRDGTVGNPSLVEGIHSAQQLDGVEEYERLEGIRGLRQEPGRNGGPARPAAHMLSCGSGRLPRPSSCRRSGACQ